MPDVVPCQGPLGARIEGLDRRRAGEPEIVQQRLLDEDDRRRNRDEQQFQGVFEMAFHDSDN